MRDGVDEEQLFFHADREPGRYHTKSMPDYAPEH
jgi:hypothetical protein